MKVLSRLEKWSSLYVLWPKLPLKLSRMFDLTEVRNIWFPIKLFSLKRVLSSVLVKMQYQCQIQLLSFFWGVLEVVLLSSPPAVPKESTVPPPSLQSALCKSSISCSLLFH